MPSFSKASKAKLYTCHADLIRLFEAVIKKTDCTIVCGYRGKDEQDKAFAEGKSKLKFPSSRHNRKPSEAVDAVPYPIDWNDLERFKALAKIVKETAKELGIAIEWGGDWKSFKDMPHYQLRKK